MVRGQGSGVRGLSRASREHRLGRNLEDASGTVFSGLKSQL